MFYTMTNAALSKLFKDAVDPDANEISRFKTKYSEMVKDGKLGKAKMASPHNKEDEDGNAILEFIYDYVDGMSTDQRDNVINTYGAGNAISLFCDWQKKSICDKEVAHMIDDELKLYEEDPVNMGLLRETVTVILQDSIGLWMDWKYE